MTTNVAAASTCIRRQAGTAETLPRHCTGCRTAIKEEVTVKTFLAWNLVVLAACGVAESDAPQPGNDKLSGSVPLTSSYRGQLLSVGKPVYMSTDRSGNGA